MRRSAPILRSTRASPNPYRSSLRRKHTVPKCRCANQHGKRGDCLAHALPRPQSPTAAWSRVVPVFCGRRKFQPALISRNHLKEVGFPAGRALCFPQYPPQRGPVVHLFAGAHVPRVDRHGQRSLCKVVHVARLFSAFAHTETMKAPRFSRLLAFPWLCTKAKARQFQ